MRLYQQINGINKKRICKFIVVTILFISVSSVFLNSSIVVYAWSAGGLRSTIASIIVSMLMSSGAGVTNMDWLNQLNTAYGVESSIGTLENAISQGLLTESAGTLVDTGLSDAIMANSAYTDLGLDTLFTTTADDALIQAGTVAASGGANIAAESIGAITLGTVGQAFVAVGAGIGLGVLANHFINKFKKAMFAGSEITQDEINDYIANGQYVSWVTGTTGIDDKLYYVYDSSVFFQFKYLDGNYEKCCLYSFDGNIHPYKRYQMNNDTWYDRSGSESTVTSYYGSDWNPLIETRPISNYVSGVRNGTIEPYKSFSPDVIGSDGNQRGTYDPDNGYSFPYITPYYDPTQKGLQPIPMEDYMDFARDAIDNTENGDIDDLQGDLFDNFINPYLEQNEPVIPEPEPDYTDPSVIPEQPDYNPKIPVSDTDISDSDPYTTPDLMDRFPFCIPNDILAIFNKFKFSREAPVIDWNFKYDAIGLDYHLVIDLSDYDDVASLLRTLELIFFVVGLGAATRKLLGA